MGEHPKGQLSLEFLIVLAVFASFIFILISSLSSSKFLSSSREQAFLMNVKTLQLVESERSINNALTDMEMIVKGCILANQVVCRDEGLVKIANISYSDYSGMKSKPLS